MTRRIDPGPADLWQIARLECDSPQYGIIPAADIKDSLCSSRKGSYQQITKYVTVSATHSFVPVTIETNGSWCPQSMDFIEEIERRITAITNEQLDTAYLYQRMSVTL